MSLRFGIKIHHSHITQDLIMAFIYTSELCVYSLFFYKYILYTFAGFRAVKEKTDHFLNIKIKCNESSPALYYNRCVVYFSIFLNNNKTFIILIRISIFHFWTNYIYFIFLFFDNIYNTLCPWSMFMIKMLVIVCFRLSWTCIYCIYDDYEIGLSLKVLRDNKSFACCLNWKKVNIFFCHCVHFNVHPFNGIIFPVFLLLFPCNLL